MNLISYSSSFCTGSGTTVSFGSSYEVFRDRVGNNNLPSEGKQKLIVVPVVFSDYGVEKLGISEAHYIDTINKAFFGLNKKYMDDVLAHEMPGIIPDRKWKEKNVGSSWVHGDTIISGIGQGFILTNCLQLAVMMARIASNKVIIPRIIYSDIRPQFENLNLQKKNIQYVFNGLEQVTKPGGTASGSAINVNGAKMGGKTGTSQVRSISKKERATGVLTNEQLQWNMRNHGLFVGFAPTDKPRYAVCAITEHSGGSGQAARTVSAVMQELLKGSK